MEYAARLHGVFRGSDGDHPFSLSSSFETLEGETQLLMSYRGGTTYDDIPLAAKNLPLTTDLCAPLYYATGEAASPVSYPIILASRITTKAPPEVTPYFRPNVRSDRGSCNVSYHVFTSARNDDPSHLVYEQSIHSRSSVTRNSSYYSPLTSYISLEQEDAQRRIHPGFTCQRYTRLQSHSLCEDPTRYSGREQWRQQGYDG
jgi:hypothetical protein